MSQDMVHTGQVTGLPVPADPWMSGSTALGMPQSPPTAGVQPLQRIHRLLRGRYIVAAILGLIGGVAGGYYGWSSVKPTYRATGIIEIKPYTPRLAESDKVMPYYTQHMATEAARIRTADVVRVAMETPEWRDAGGPPPTPRSLGGFQAGLSATQVKNSFYINVAFEHADPKLAAAGVNAVLAAFRKTYDTRKGEDAKVKIEQMAEARNTLLKKIASHERDIATIAEKYGTSDLQKLYESKVDTQGSYERALIGAEANFAAARDVRRLAQEGGNPLTIGDLAQIDKSGMLRRRIEQRQELELRLANMANMGNNNPAVVQVRQQLANLENLIEQQANEIRKTTYGLMPDLSGTGTSIVVTETYIRQLEDRVKHLRGALEVLKTEFRALAADRFRIDQLNAEIRKYRGEYENIQSTIDSLMAQSMLSGTPGTVGSGDSPTISNDKRKRMAIAGFGLGAAVPVLAIVLLGLIDTRFRYSDDAGGGMGGLTLLGILPNLPDRLSDPQQASIAAHCVHQIRTMLQLSMNRDAPTSLCITSAASGDGKTSLSLALGLSFAASGSRTLMIDSDLVGGGLSNRLGQADSPTGVLEAVTTGRLLEYVRTTDVQDLAVLPVGQANVQHAGVFSPTAMRRLINEAKKHFEVIVIDTGPLMGAIEATPVCASVDGVILAVSRGQSRPLVERSLEHLRNIGARISGVVFNRAQARDFARSISGMSVRSAARSAANGYGHNRRSEGGHLGPVAKAVHTDVGTDRPA